MNRQDRSTWMNPNLLKRVNEDYSLHAAYLRWEEVCTEDYEGDFDGEDRVEGETVASGSGQWTLGYATKPQDPAALAYYLNSKGERKAWFRNVGSMKVAVKKSLPGFLNEFRVGISPSGEPTYRGFEDAGDEIILSKQKAFQVRYAIELRGESVFKSLGYSIGAMPIEEWVEFRVRYEVNVSAGKLEIGRDEKEARLVIASSTGIPYEADVPRRPLQPFPRCGRTSRELSLL